MERSPWTDSEQTAERRIILIAAVAVVLALAALLGVRLAMTATRIDRPVERMPGQHPGQLSSPRGGSEADSDTPPRRPIDAAAPRPRLAPPLFVPVPERAPLERALNARVPDAPAHDPEPHLHH